VIALIHLRNDKLPNRRVELYQKATETLVDNWMSARRVTPDDWDSDEALDDLLPAMAWRLHTESSGGLIGQDDLPTTTWLTFWETGSLPPQRMCGLRRLGRWERWASGRRARK
jgi:hypothetical protein